MERPAGVEPAPSAWQALALPIREGRFGSHGRNRTFIPPLSGAGLLPVYKTGVFPLDDAAKMVGNVGIEPTCCLASEASDSALSPIPDGEASRICTGISGLKARDAAVAP